MITRNLALMISRWTGTNNSVGLDKNSVTNLGGDKHVVYANTFSEMVSSKTGVTTDTYNFLSVIIGSGTSTPSFDQYSLDEMIDLRADSLNRSWNWSYGSTVFTATFVNTTDSEITVSEVGLTCCYYYGGTRYECLLVREVMTPTIVAPGDSISVSIKIF